MQIKPSPARRNVVLDIETVPLNTGDPEGALSAVTGKIVCIAMLIDDGASILDVVLTDANEASILARFWQAIRKTDLIIGFNVLNFDLQFIRQRSWILSIRPSRRIDLRRYYSPDVLDLMQIWSGWGATKYPSLNKLGEVLDAGTKSGIGSQVLEWWNAGDALRIADYCVADVVLTYKIFCRLMFQGVPQRFSQFESTLQANLFELAEPGAQVAAPKKLGKLILFPSPSP